MSFTPQHEYRIERLSPDNLYHLQTLYKASFGKTVSLNMLQKKYDTKVFGAEWVGYLALTNDQKPAAFYGVIPCQFKINDTVLLAAQSADTMTHPLHRKKGLFLTLAKRTYQLARLENIQFIFGFPNDHSYPGFVKLGWEFLPKPMQFFTLKGSKLPLASLCLRIPVLKTLYQLLTKPVQGNKVMRIASSHTGLSRSDDFIRYKKNYSTTFEICSPSIQGWIKNDGALKVGYLHTDKNTTPLQLETFLSSYAKKLGCRNVILMTSENSPLYKIATKIEIAKAGLPIGFYNLTEHKLDFSQAEFEYCDIDIF